MADKDLEVFEKRAQEAEKQIALLTKKLEQIEQDQSMNHRFIVLFREFNHSQRLNDKRTLLLLNLKMLHQYVTIFISLYKK
jgi:hypothetical protein